MDATLVERIRGIVRSSLAGSEHIERDLISALEAHGEVRAAPETKDDVDAVLQGAVDGRMQVIGTPDGRQAVVVSVEDLAALLCEPAREMTFGEAIEALPFRGLARPGSVRGRRPGRLSLMRHGASGSGPEGEEATAGEGSQGAGR